ncbi:dockerin type I domain-containing protein, partial [Arthrospira platensis SPKY1]|nr:dockerin type I domain-containing protein [Arthrospira platensis SPKY1]
LTGSLPGDINGDGEVNSGDVFYLINYLFAGGPPPVGDGDVNGDGNVDSGDVFYLINYLFAGGPPPV